MTDTLNKKRRKLIGGSLGITTAVTVLPSSWTKPVMQAIVLPAHAQTSPMPSFSVEKLQTGGPSPATTEGDVIEYEIIVTNTGTEPLTGVVATDTLPDDTVVVLSAPIESLNTDNVLEVSETWTYTTTYTVTTDDLVSGNDLINSVSVETNEVPEQQTDDVATPVIIPICPLPVIIDAVESGPTSGTQPCTFIFTVVSGDPAVPITVVDITASGEAATTTFDFGIFGEVTSTNGVQVVVSNTASAPFCDDLTLFGDITFTVTTMCAANPEPIETEFSLLSI